MCQLAPEKCTTATVDKCTNNIYDCLANKDDEEFFCRDYPALCFRTYETGVEMIQEICDFDNGRYCTSDRQLDMNMICNSAEYQKLPGSIHKSTSLQQLCYDADWTKICREPAVAEKLCPTGNAIIPSFCEFATGTNACTNADGTNNDASTAHNIYDQLAKRENWGFVCREWPEFCPQEYTSGQMMIDDICKSGYCGSSGLPDLSRVCKEWDQQTSSVQRKSSFG
jgi:hypothetical protein